MNKHMRCRECCDLLPDYEWLDIENKHIVDKHIHACNTCCEKKDMILGKYLYEETGGINMIDKIDFTEDIMKSLSREQKPVTTPFLYHLLGLLVVLELLVIYCSGFTGFKEIADFVFRLYQMASEVTFPVLDESLGLFEVTDYLSIPAEYLPGSFMAILLFTGCSIASALFLLSGKRSTYYGS